MADYLSGIVRRSTCLDVRSPRLRIGFLGVGWIGLHRMRALVREAFVRESFVDVVGICDPSPAAVEAAGEVIDAQATDSLDELLDLDLDGLVVATPSAQHAVQAQQALQRGVAVFCQKPLARNRSETDRLIATAREADRLLGVDFSYRYLDGATAMRNLIRSGDLGEIYSVDLTFHNAYGPDKAWFFDPVRSGGGCVIDLGIHLVDLVGWMTGEWGFEDVRSTLWHRGQIIGTPCEVVEDCAVAEWRQPEGALVRLACSWNLPAGQDAVIEAKFYGTEGAVALKNVGGSFFDFVCEHYRGTAREPLSDATAPSDELPDLHGEEAWDQWGGAAVVGWARQLAEGSSFDPQIEHASAVAGLIDEIYLHPRRD